MSNAKQLKIVDHKNPTIVRCANGTITIKDVACVYPTLDKPWASDKYPGSKPMYSITFFIPKTATEVLKVLGPIMDKAYTDATRQKLPARATLLAGDKYPLDDCALTSKFSGYEDYYVMKARTKNKPSVFGPQCVEIKETQDIAEIARSNMVIRVNIDFYSSTTYGKVSTNLHKVQFVGECEEEFLARSTATFEEVGFEAVEGYEKEDIGFSSDESTSSDSWGLQTQAPQARDVAPETPSDW